MNHDRASTSTPSEIYEEDRAFILPKAGDPPLDLPETKKPYGRRLECLNKPGETFSVAEVSFFLEVSEETIYLAMEQRGGEIEGLHFRWVNVSKSGFALGVTKGPRKKHWVHR